MTEAELCLSLEHYYRDYEIYKEVPGNGGRCDLYVKKGPLWVAIEVKKQFSTTLIYQAMRNKPYAHYSYVAIPDKKNGSAALSICKSLGIGVMELREKYGSGWQILCEAKFTRKITPLRVTENMKLSIAGVQHNSNSEFKTTVSYIKQNIDRNGGRYLIKSLFEKDHFHYHNSRSARQCITRLCREGVIKEFHIEGKYFITQ